MGEWLRFMQARNWMKSNERFLATWHAHVGYKLNLFDSFSKSSYMEDVAKKEGLHLPLLERWIDVGLEIGHLKRNRNGKIQAKKRLIKYASAKSEESVGILLREMMELHIPTLLEYPDLLQSNHRITYLEETFANVVAETSTLLEKAAIPSILRAVKKTKPASIIDMGCGYGSYLKSVHEHFPKIQLQGVEINPEVAKKAVEKVAREIPIYHGDMVDFIDEFAGQVDMIMAHNLLYYFPELDRKKLYKKIASILRDSGTMTLITPLVKAKHGQMFTAAFNAFLTAHENLYPLPSLKEIKDDGKSAGFKVVHAKPLIREGGWYLVTLKKQK